MPENDMKKDTIAAQATPPGRGGIGIIRISGPQVKQIMFHMLGEELTARQATHVTFRSTAGEILDQGVAIFFPHPHSFTGEDVLELQGHGSPIVIDNLLQQLLTLGARLARPGEFSERAFLNGKMDLVQAEAVADLISASSVQAARSAMRSLQGAFSNEIDKLIEKMIYVRMYIEAAIDFTDEEIDFLDDQKIAQNLKQICCGLITLQTNAKQGSLLREGITTVIAGAPNVGKSSLLNRLSGKDVAIVTDIPGTTRDILHDHILIEGIPIHLIDTAGLRDSHDVIEQEGIKRAYLEFEKADVILYVYDNETIPTAVFDSPLLTSRPIIFVRNKIDLTHTSPSMHSDGENRIVSLSAKSGEGIELLKTQIKSLIGVDSNREGIFSGASTPPRCPCKSRAVCPTCHQTIIPLAVGGTGCRGFTTFSTMPLGNYGCIHYGRFTWPYFCEFLYWEMSSGFLAVFLIFWPYSVDFWPYF